MKFQKLSRAACIISHKLGLMQFWKSKQCSKSQREAKFSLLVVGFWCLLVGFFFVLFFKFILQIPYFIAQSQGNETKYVSILIYLICHLEEPYKNAFWRHGLLNSVHWTWGSASHKQEYSLCCQTRRALPLVLYSWSNIKQVRKDAVDPLSGWLTE